MWVYCQHCGNSIEEPGVGRRCSCGSTLYLVEDEVPWFELVQTGKIAGFNQIRRLFPGMPPTFAHQTFEKLSLKSFDLRGAHFQGCKFLNVEWVECDCRGSRFSGCFFDYSLFSNTKFAGAQFQDTNLDAGVHSCDFGGAVFRGSRIDFACTHSDFSGADFRGAQILELSGADLSGCLWDNATLIGGLQGSPSEELDKMHTLT